MSQKSLKLARLIHAPPEAIIQHLMQPTSYIGLQPFLRSVHILAHGNNAQGCDFVHYTAVEHVPLFAGLKLNTSLDVMLTNTRPAAQIVSVVHSSASVQVEFVYDFDVVGDETRLTLAVTAQAPLLLAGFVLNRARTAQTTVLHNLKQRLENGTPA